MNNIYIAPSILSADFSKLGDEVKKVISAGADWLHIDIMDGNFVPNISFGSSIVSSIRGLTDIIFDAHLMVDNCDKYIEEFANAGCDVITIHAENNHHLHRSLLKIKNMQKKAGLAINPATNVSVIEPVLDYLDVILVMSVNPGFGGQSFIPNSIEKIKKVKKLVNNRPILIEVDGGINDKNIGAVRKAGCDVFVAGSYIYKSNDYRDKINLLKKNALNACEDK